MNIPVVLNDIRPGAAWVLTGDGYDGLEWLDTSPKPTLKQIEAAWPRAEAKQKNAVAENQRASAYKQEADPLFMYWQAGEGTKDVWLAKRAEIRRRFPYVEVPK